MAQAVIETPGYRKYITVSHKRIGHPEQVFDVVSVETVKPVGVLRSNNHKATQVYKLRCSKCLLEITVTVENAEVGQ